MAKQRLVQTRLGLLARHQSHRSRTRRVSSAILQEMQQSRAEVAVIENVLLMACLMALGAGITVALLIGFIYYLEIQND